MIRYQFESSSSNRRLTHVGTYKRTLPVSLDRMYENALDWEHLPYVHSLFNLNLEISIAQHYEIERIHNGPFVFRTAVRMIVAVSVRIREHRDPDENVPEK